MTTGQDLLKRARRHLGEEYVNRQVPKDDPDWKGPWDCAEFVSWVVYQETRQLVGCIDNAAPPKTADAYTGAWKRDALADVVARISVEEAAATAGAILLRYPPKPGVMGHIVFCDGEGRTVEAMGKAYGVVEGDVAGRRWDAGVLIKGVTYDRPADPPPVAGPAALYALNAPNMNRTIVTEIQKALKLKGFDPGAVDGEFGRRTMEAVARFQDRQGLVSDGEVGSSTAKALGVNLLGAVAAAAGAVIRGVVGSNPLLAVAAAVFPEIAKAIAGDKAGAVAAQASRAVSDVTGASDAATARETLAADPEATAALQTRLAEIALAQEESRRKAEAEDRAALEAASARRRKDELEAFRAELTDLSEVRNKGTEWAKLGGPMAWGAPLVSIIVTAGFFGFLTILVVGAGQVNGPASQILNITVGALTAAFSTVVSYWLGSSLSSRNKDAANVELQVEQNRQAKEIVKTQTDFVKEMVEKAPAAMQPAAPPSAAPAAPAAAKASRFQACLDIVLPQEGGFVNDPDDPGGATNFGITIATLSSWRSDDGKAGNAMVTADDVRNLTLDEARDIYRARYWNVLRCDELPAGLDLLAFDFGVNAGPSRAARLLQKAVAAEQDSSVGPRTIAAARAGSVREAISAMSQAKLDYYRGLEGWAKYGKGWTNRARAVETAALAMAAG